MVIPIEESLIYVRPLYLRAQGGRIPELTRVIVAYQNQIVMESTLEAGLSRLFGAVRGGTGSAEAVSAAGAAAAAGADAADRRADREEAPSEQQGMAALATEAQATYERALAAQKAGDWARYGEEIRRLGEILGQMRQQ